MREYRSTFKPVRILVAGKYKTVYSARGASRALFDMPNTSSDANHRATMRAMQNLNDAVTPERVREAFIAAAVDAKMDVKF